MIPSISLVAEGGARGLSRVARRLAEGYKALGDRCAFVRGASACVNPIERRGADRSPPLDTAPLDFSFREFERTVRFR